MQIKNIMKNAFTFESKEFISAKEAAKLVGYVPDYVGQLARTGKIEARMVGRSWFVTRDSILKHREMNLSATGASRIADFLSGAPTIKEIGKIPSASSMPERGRFFESELAYGREDFSLTPFLGKKVISPMVGSRRPLVPLFSKAASLVTPELMQKAAALAVSSAFVFGAYAATDNGMVARAASFAASAARAVTAMSISDVRNAVSDFAKNIPSYAAAGAEEFAARSSSLSIAARATARAAYAGVVSFGRAPVYEVSGAVADSESAISAVADIPETARGFSREIAKAFFRGANLLARDARRSVLSFLGAPVPGTGLAVSPPPVLPVVTPPEPQSAPRAFVAAAERITTSERIVERVIVGEVSREELNEKLSILNNKLSSEIYKISADGVRNAANITNVYQTVSHTNKIDKLRTVEIFEPTISGGSITKMTGVGADRGEFTTLSGGNTTVSGTLSVTATSTLTNSLVVDTNTLFVDATNNRVGVGTTSPGATFAVQGDALIAGNLSVTGLIATSTSISFLGLGTNMLTALNASGNLVATSSPTASHYFATSTTATSTFAGGLTVQTNKFVVESSSGNVGLGTTTPGTTLAVQGVANFAPATSTFYGDLRFNSLVATSTTATSTIAGFLDVNGTGTNATSSFAGGLKTAGLSTSNGLTITASSGAILSLATATSTFSGGIDGISARFTNGVEITGGSLTNGSTATSTWSGGLSATGLASSRGLTLSGGSISTPEFTAGSVLFSDGSLIRQNNANFFWDNTNARLGLGTVGPKEVLSIIGNILSSGDLSFSGGDLNIGTGTATSTLTSANSNLGLGSTTPWGFFSIAPVPTQNTRTPSFAISTTTTVGGGTATSTTFLVAQSGYTGLGGTTTPSALLSLESRSLATTPLFMVSTSTALGTSTSFLIDSNGKVGIGSTSPSATLGIAGNLYVTGTGGATSSVFGGTIEAQGTSATSTFAGGVRTAGLSTSNGLTITASSGAILSLATATSSFAGGLAGTSASFSQGIVVSGGSLTNTSTATSTWSGGLGLTSLSASNGLTITGGSIRSSAADLDIFAGGANDILLNSSGGNVGIGTTSPQTLLHLYKDTGLNPSDTAWDLGAGSQFLRIEDSNPSVGTEQYLSLGATVGGVFSPAGSIVGKFWNGTTLGRLGFATNNAGTQTVKMVIDETGNVGIGTTSPASILAVEQSADTQLGGLTLGANGDNDYRAMFMNTSGVLSFTGGDAGTFNTATLTAGGVFTDAPSFSWLKKDREILGKDEMLEILSQTNIEKFKIIADGEGADTQIGIVLDEVHPALATHNAAGEIVGYSPMRVASVAFAGVREIFEAMSIDASGNVGLGTSTPEYKLHVIGDVAATSFVNISTKTAKKDIAYFDESDRRSMLEKIKTIGIAEYRYNGESESAPLRLGLIAEEAPAEVLSASGKGVDVYKLSTFILAGVQEQQKRLESLELRVAGLEEKVGQIGQIGSIGQMAEKISAAFAEFKTLVVETFTTKKLCVDDVCVDKEQFKALLAGVGMAPASSSTSGVSSSTPDVIPLAGDIEAPVITLSGNNPANIEIGSVYNDLGASVTDNLDHNLGIKASLDGSNWIEIGNISLNTASSTTYTIRYRAVDNAGNIGTAERAVVVGDGAAEVQVQADAPVIVAEEIVVPSASTTSTVFLPFDEPVATSTPQS